MLLISQDWRLSEIIQVRTSAVWQLVTGEQMLAINSYRWLPLSTGQRWLFFSYVTNWWYRNMHVSCLFWHERSWEKRPTWSASPCDSPQTHHRATKTSRKGEWRLGSQWELLLKGKQDSTQGLAQENQLCSSVSRPLSFHELRNIHSSWSYAFLQTATWHQEWEEARTIPREPLSSYCYFKERPRQEDCREFKASWAT